MACEVLEVQDGLVIVVDSARSVVVPWAAVPRLVLDLDKTLRSRETRDHLARQLELGP